MADFEYQQPQRYRITNRQREDIKRQKSGSSGGIPDRWLDYLGVHRWVENTRFVPFKCPLKPEMQRHLPEDRRFTLGDLVEKLDNQGKELGLIIDLTNTDRYYKPSDIADAQIQYFKLMTPGHHKTPNETCYQRFVTEVNNFSQANQNNDKLIGVHCTHGLNRTGYLIVRYMIEEMDIDPNEALEAFNRARGHSMEKYTEDLLQRKRHSANLALNDIATMSTSASIKTDDNNHSKWPSLYSTMEAMSLTEGYKQKQQQSKSSIIPRSIQGDCNDFEAPLRSLDANINENFQENATLDHCKRMPPPQQQTQPISNISIKDEQQSIQIIPTYFGSGSNVGRGKPLKNDR